MKLQNHSNIIEVLGRNQLIAQLIQDDVHVALPLWDKGVDLVAYFIDEGCMRARGIQLKANEDARWGLDRKYEDVAGLLMVYAWFVRDATAVEIYAMTHEEAFAVFRQLGEGKHLLTESWQIKGGYSFPNVRGQLREALQPYRMMPGRWRERLTGQ